MANSRASKDAMYKAMGRPELSSGGLQGLKNKIRNLPTSAGTGEYKSLTVGESFDKLRNFFKK